MSQRKARGFCFTVNNHTDEDVQKIRTFLRPDGTSGSTPRATELVVSEETGKINGTKHLQGYVAFPRRLTVETVRTLLPRAHVRPVRNPRAAKRYCLKEGGTPLFNSRRKGNS